MKPKLSPAVTDIDWAWFARSNFEKYARQVSVYVLMVGLFICWSIPVTGISAFANLGKMFLATLTEKLDKLGAYPILHPLVEFVQSVDVLKGIVQGFLPSLALSWFILILPYIIKSKYLIGILPHFVTVILSLHKYLLHSQYDRALLRVFWLFLTLNVFLVSVLANSTFRLFNSIEG
jgi:hypothetical protein